jgi:hypothetical protein
MWNQAIGDSSFSIRDGICVMNGELRRVDDEGVVDVMDQFHPVSVDGMFRFRSTADMVASTPDGIIEWLGTCRIDSEMVLKCPEE